jgi:hypothetical protein
MTGTQKSQTQPSMQTTKARSDWFLLLLFSTGAALLATLWGYNYSAGNAEEQLPFLLRALDPSFLGNDFFTNTFDQYGPRTFFTHFVRFSPAKSLSQSHSSF